MTGENIINSPSNWKVSEFYKTAKRKQGVFEKSTSQTSLYWRCRYFWITLVYFTPNFFRGKPFIYNKYWKFTHHFVLFRLFLATPQATQSRHPTCVVIHGVFRDWILLVCFSWRYEATEVPRVNFVMSEALFEITRGSSVASYLHEKQTSRIQSLYLYFNYFIKIVPFWLRNIRFFNTKHPVIILRASLFAAITSHVAFSYFSYVYRSRKHWECKYYVLKTVQVPMHDEIYMWVHSKYTKKKTVHKICVHMTI